MAENSGIEWTHHTFNPWIGCTKVSAACDHCYAEAWDKRFGGERWGPHAPRTRTKTWGNPVKWNRQAEEQGKRFRVFCASLADVFDNHRSIDPAWRRELWLLIESTPHLDWLLLTKRPQNIAKMLPENWGAGYSNVWLGTTVENQQEANRRIQPLLDVPATIRFLSCEPLVGPIRLDLVARGGINCVYYDNVLTGFQSNGYGGSYGFAGKDNPTIHWVITGGESGHSYRPAEADWFRMLRDQCAEAKVPFLFKQWEGANQKIIKAKGRELDGVVHDGYPVAA